MKTSNTQKFVTLRLIDSIWNGSDRVRIRGGLICIRLDTITEVNQIKEETVYSSEAEHQRLRYTKNTEDSPHPTAMVARISTTNAHGLGINGLQFDHQIDEKSWKLLCKELGLTWK